MFLGGALTQVDPVGPEFDPEAPGLSSEWDIVKSISFSMTKHLFMSLSFDDARMQYLLCIYVP